MLTEAPAEMRSRLDGHRSRSASAPAHSANPAAGAISDGIGPRGAVIVMAAAGLVLTGLMLMALKKRPPVLPSV